MSGVLLARIYLRARGLSDENSRKVTRAITDLERLRPIGRIRSELRKVRGAPRQGSEGDEIILVTWLHRGRRDVLRVRPRGDRRYGMAGVFATRSPDRPNPLGL